MADDDLRVAAWNMRGPAGMTVSRPFTSSTAVTTLSVYTGGTVTDVDDLTDATEHAATVDGDGLGGTITVAVPTVSSVPLRLVIDGAVVAVGRLTPSTVGTDTRDDTVTIAVAEASTLTLDLPSIVVNEGAVGDGVHPDLASHDALGLATQAELEAEQTARTTGDADTLAAAVQRANHTGTQASTTISDFTEAVQDAVAALLGAGSNITLTYSDATDSLTIDATGGGTSYTDEEVRDAIGVALVGAGLISVTPNDALDTITITTTATANSTDAALRDRDTHTGVQAIATVSGLQAALDAKETPAGAQAKADAALTAANTYTDTAVDNATSSAVQKSTYDANTILKADTDDTPTALTVPASRLVGRKATGDIAALTPAELAALFGTPDGTKFLADDGTLKTPSGGSGGGVLASRAYNPGTVGTSATTSTSFADVDATNMIFPSFVAPASGTVILQATVSVSVGSGTTLALNLRNSGGDVAGTPTDAFFTQTGGISVGRITTAWRLTGLTPGATYNYKLGFARLFGSTTTTVEYGGARGPAVFVVMSA